ncbi:MBOAT family O-acyltransferase [Tautonia plasticadhaerens]|uniref:Peptidoglycan O-acetyltransferase n=1 Tax=Tautonia plasticadhaerens TaxID=2527974 RepID=A0A518GW84_9BACT|nr:MBOAT family protein [Tautonia plasticadhaerens]QDV32853.1 Peptidoglycan O-acetyltransferase [Tautonia plasticadhaerens]
MLFNSLAFAAFFAVVFALYWALGRRHRAQNAVLLAAGYAFYGCWDWRFLGLLVLSTVVDYGCGLAVARVDAPRARGLVLGLSLAVNLGVLGFFKYCDFFTGSLQVLLDRVGVEASLPVLDVLLPIGISFYTFQSMAYVIDVYRRHVAPTRDLLQFAVFVSFFPHLVAGPIMQPRTLLPQVARPRRFDLDQFYRGAHLIAWGLVKKVVVADNLAPIVDDLFGRWASIDGGLALLAVYAFAFQIYCDFSGYTDMARGVARCLGFELALNFNLPYFAASPREFWQRWHISLSQWLRDYLYIPLGGSRGDRAVWAGNVVLAALVGCFGVAGCLAVEEWPGFASWRSAVPTPAPMLAAGLLIGCSAILAIRGRSALTGRNLMLTMILGGLWHGAAWTFVAWGAYQGILLVGHRLLEPLLDRLRPSDPVHRACWTGLCIVVTFHLVCLGWLLFRADSIAQASGMLGLILSGPTLPPASSLVPVLAVVLPLLLVQAAQHATGDLEILQRTPWYVRSLAYTAGFYAIVLGGEFGGGQFLYFQF